MEKKFNFRLEKVLNLRSQKVNQEKLAFGKVMSIRLDKEKEVEEQQNYANGLNNNKSKIANAAFYQTYQNHKEFVKEEIIKLEDELTQIKEIEELRRVKLTEAMKEEKVLEKLKEKKKEIHLEEMKREETINLDEIAQQRFIRSKEK